MPYRMEWNGRYKVFDQNHELKSQTDDFSYVVEIMGNNQGSGWYWIDTQAKENQ